MSFQEVCYPGRDVTCHAVGALEWVKARPGDWLSSPSITSHPLAHCGSGAIACRRGFEVFRGDDER